MSSAADEHNHKGGVSFMKKQLSTIGKSLGNDPHAREEWKEMAAGFSSLFDRYLKTKYDVVEWL